MPQLLTPRALEPVLYKRRHHSEKPARCHQTIAGAAMKAQHSLKYMQVSLKKGIPGTHLALLHTSPLDLSIPICKTGTSALLASQGSRENLIFWSQNRQTRAELEASRHWQKQNPGSARAPIQQTAQ